MATASRTRPTSSAAAAAQPVAGKAWMLSATAGGLAVAALALGQVGLPIEIGLGIAIVAGLIGIVSIGAQPALDGQLDGSERTTVLGFSALWLVVLAVPMLLRVFPGTPLAAQTAISGPGVTLPVTVATGGAGRIDLLTEGQLMQGPSGAVLPVRYNITIDAGSGTAAQVVTGEFTEQLKTQRLGRRGTTVVHQQHVSEQHEISGTGDALTISAVTVEPEGAPPILVTAYPHHLPPWPIAVAIGLALLGAAIWIDRLPGLHLNDGTFTLSTGAVIGALYFFTTDNAVHPGFGTFIGAGIFGGALGMAVAGASWWILKRVVPASH